MNEGIELKIARYGDPKTIVATLTGRQKPEYLDELGIGGGSFSISSSDPEIVADPSLLDYRNVVHVYVDGKAIGQWIIKTKDTIVIGKGEKRDEIITVAGPGLLSWFDDAVVEPMGGQDLESYDERWFNFATAKGPWYTRLEAYWHPVVDAGTIYQQTWWKNSKALEKWPESAKNVRWVWDIQQPPHPAAGTVYFRHEFSTLNNQDIAMYLVADDEAELFVDGQLIATYEWPGEAVRVPMLLTEGNHVVGVKVTNKGGPAGMAFAMYKLDVNGNEVFWRWTDTNNHVDARWVCMGSPTPPAWSPGEILSQLMGEALSRGVRFPNYLTPTYNATTDSNGDAWPDGSRVEWTFAVAKDDYSSILNRFREMGIQTWINPETFELEMSVAIGTNRTTDPGSVTFELGKNLLRAESNGLGNVKNTTLIKTQHGFIRHGNAASITKYGNIEEGAEMNVGWQQAVAMANMLFDARANPEEAATYEVTTSHEVPYIDFFKGDLVLAPNDKGLRTPRQVMSISVTENAQGLPKFTLEFDVITKSNQEKILAMVQKSSGGGGAGSMASTGSTRTSVGRPIVVSPGQSAAEEVPQQPTGLAATSTGSWNISGTAPISKVTLTWGPVTLTTQNNEMVASGYRVWMRDTSDAANAWAEVAQVATTTAKIDGLMPGKTYEFKVQALGVSTASIDSSPISHIAAGPTTPQAAPTTPILTTSRALLDVKWDGLLVGDNTPPPHFRYVYTEIYNVTDGPATYTRVGTILQRGGGTITIAGLTPGKAYRARLRAVDGMGIVSTASGFATIVVGGIDLGELDTSVQAAIDAAAAVGQSAQDEFDDFYATQFTDLDVAFNNFEDVILPAMQGDLQGVIARGENLIINGSGELGNLTNWPTGAVLNPNRAPAGFPNMFESVNTTSMIQSVKNVTVNPTETYMMSGTFIGKAGMRHYLALVPYDIDGLYFSLQNANRLEGSETTLAAPLNPGDTTIQLTNGSGWPSGVYPSGSYLAWWPYVNGKGQTLNPSDGYTRNIRLIGGVTRSGNTINLTSPWAGEALPAGKVVTLNYSGASYIYPNFQITTSDIQRLEGTLSGVSQGFHGKQGGKFWPGVAFVRPAVLLNNGLLVNDGTKPGFTGLRMVNDTARQVAISAQASANSRNRVIKSLSNATGTASADGQPFIAGDTWWKKDSLGVGGKVIAQWDYDGTAWLTSEFNHQVIASIDFDKGVFGTLHGNYLEAGTITSKQQAIGDFENLVDNVMLQGPDVTIANTPGWTITSGTGADVENASMMPGKGIRFSGLASTTVQNDRIFEIVPGLSGLAPAYVMQARAQNSRTGSTIRMYLRWYDRNMADLGTSSELTFSSSSWSEMTSTTDINPPTDARFGRLELTAGTATGGTTSRIGNFFVRRKGMGSLLIDGTVQGRHAAFNTFTAQHVVIGTTENNIPNGMGEQSAPAAWSSGLTWDTADKPEGMAGSFSSTKGQGTYASAGGYWDVEPNSEYLMEIWLKADVPNSRLYLELRDQANAHGTTNTVPPGYTYAEDSWASNVYPFSSGVVPTDWQRFTSLVKTTPTTTKLKVGSIYFNHSNGTERNAQVNILMRMRSRTGPELMVDGAILARHVGALQIDTPHLRAQAVDAEKIKARSITAEHVAFRSMTGDELALGTLQVGHVTDTFGRDLVIEENESIVFAVGQAQGAVEAVDGVAGEIRDMRTYYDFGPNGAEISTPGSPISLWFQSDRIAFMQGGQDGVELAAWTAGQMIVNEFVGTTASLGNHQLTQYTNGTVMRYVG